MNKGVFSVLLFGMIFCQSVYAQQGFTQEGYASVYADHFEGRTTASGERYSFRKATCSHLALPFGTLVRVTNLENNRSVVLRVNDRGPFVPDRIIDISKSAAEKLGFPEDGNVKVRIEVIEENGEAVVMPLPVGDTNKIEEKQAEPQEQKIDTEEKPFTEIEKEWYTLEVSKIQPEGFAIQIGSFKELANLLKVSEEVKRTIRKDVFVQVTIVNNEKLYRMMVGPFKTRKDAEVTKEKVAQLHPACFILEIK